MIEPETEFLDLPKSIRCDKHRIGEYDNKIPSNLTAEQILIRSGNIGSVRIAQKVGPEKYKSFLEKIGILSQIEFDIEEVAPSRKFNFGKCKISYSFIWPWCCNYNSSVSKRLCNIIKWWF